jgi:hypothetical protein
MVSTTKTNKPLNPRGNDQSPKGYNRAALYSGKALDFDGVNDEISGSNSFSETNHSISAYITTSSASAYKSVFEFRDSGADGGVLWVLPGNNLVYQINGVSTTNFNVNDDEWYHVVGVYDGTNQSIYINGNLWETITNSGSVSVSANWKIGSRSFSTGSNWFDGMIGGVKAFNTALTAAQVADLYNNPEKVVPTGVDDSALKLWLPMQEGAGTTAYDGSGNGNHGTISGATWTHGIGAPVAQTAVIDWNKGANILPYSEELNQWGKQVVSVSQSSATAPDGSTNAYDLTDADSGQYGILVPGLSVAMAGDYVGSLFVKKTTGALSHYPGFDIGQPGAYVIIDTTNGTTATAGTGGVYSDVTITSHNDDWWRVSAKATINSTSKPMRIWPAISENGTGVSVSVTGTNTFWGAQVEQADAIGPYVRTGATAQTSPVLLPQGLTTGRDITGVNLFENVRKQGALNLDGNSWAEVHDNESLDFGTGSFTLEAWVVKSYINSGSSINIIMSLGGDVAAGTGAGFTTNSTNVAFKYVGYQSHNVATSEWVHIVGVYDETNAILYVNGIQEDSQARTAINITNDLVKYIGRDTSSVRYYQDQIAQPRIYNRALTAEEVQRNYNAGKNIYQ